MHILQESTFLPGPKVTYSPFVKKNIVSKPLGFGKGPGPMAVFRHQEIAMKVYDPEGEKPTNLGWNFSGPWLMANQPLN